MLLRRQLVLGSVAAVAVAGTFGGFFVLHAGAAADRAIETATIGWAAQSGGTSGGSAAAAANTYTVRSRAELMTALVGTNPTTGKTNKTAPKIIKWVGAIDMTEGKPYTSQADQKARAEVKLQPNTTIIGVGTNASLPNGWFKISKVDNVIIRNITVTNPCDLAPKWDSTDGAGNYNSEFDGLTVDGGTHVWIDHMTFTDKPYTDNLEPLGNKDKYGVRKHIQCHDGALDVKNGSDYVTVSNSVFDSHDKNTLVGASDTRTSDNGHLTVTFANNRYTAIGQRAPRVRFGKVHVVGNYYTGSTSDPVYPHLYSIGTGYQAKILSQNNVFDITGAAAGSCAAVVKNPNTAKAEGAFTDAGSLVNGAAMTGCTAPTSVGWSLPSGYSVPAVAASRVKSYVLANAGAGKL